jgi:hypothetical protein
VLSLIIDFDAGSLWRGKTLTPASESLIVSHIVVVGHGGYVLLFTVDQAEVFQSQSPSPKDSC